MDQIFNDNLPLDMKKLELLSSKGFEYNVYKYEDLAIKIFKDNYYLPHLTIEELNILKSISPKRILLPTGILKNRSNKLLGYSMPFINNPLDLLSSSTRTFLKELNIIREDIELLSTNHIILRDINDTNTIYNGHLYLIDPGNYLIDNLDEICLFNNKNISQDEKINLIRHWNYNKINILIDTLLFTHFSFYDHYKIIKYIKALRKEQATLYTLDCLLLNPNLTLRESLQAFYTNYISKIPDNPEEKAYILSLTQK